MSAHPFLWTRMAALSLVRSWRSTLVLLGMLMASIASLVFLSAMAVGVNDAMVRNSTTLYSGQVSGFGLPASASPSDLELDGVEAVLRRAPLAGVLMKGEKAEPVRLVSVEPEREKAHAAFWKKAVSGRFVEGGNKEVFISESLAEGLGSTVGDRLVFTRPGGGERVGLTVSGVYRTGVPELDRGTAFVPRGVVAGEGAAWNAAVFLEDGVSPGEVVERYGEMNLSGASFETWDELMPDLRQLIDLNYVSMTVVMALVFGVVSLGIAGAFSIYIFKNLREYGVMKAMGVTSGEMALLITVKIMLMNLAASVAGVALGAASVAAASAVGIDLTRFTSHNQYFSVSGVVYPRLTFYSLCLPPAAAFCFGLVSSAWPTFIIARRKAAEILRII